MRRERAAGKAAACPVLDRHPGLVPGPSFFTAACGVRYETGVHGGYVYILASRYRGALYIGMTADLLRRMWEHCNGLGSAHARQYGINRLVWYERHEDIRTAIAREKSVKRWPREYKFNVIEAANPDWRDLAGQLHAV